MSHSIITTNGGNEGQSYTLLEKHPSKQPSGRIHSRSSRTHNSGWTDNRSGLYVVHTSVITPMRSISRAGLRGSSLGVECPLGGEEEAKEDAVAEAVMEAP